MENLTLEQALIKFNKKTKQQLERTLTAQNISWSVEGRGKKAVYSISGKKVSEWEKLFGFEPVNKVPITRLLLFLSKNSGGVFLTDTEMAFYLGLNEGTTKKARLELVQAGFITETKEQRDKYKFEGAETLVHRIKGREVSLDDVGRYYNEASQKSMELLLEEESFLVDVKEVESEAMKAHISEHGSYYFVVKKELCVELSEEQIEFLEKQ